MFKKMKINKTILTVVLAVIFIIVLAGGILLYKYLSPTPKELFLMAHKKTIDLMDEEAENFKNTKNISFLTEILSGGDYEEDNEKVIYPLSFVINSIENRDNEEHNLSVKFNEKEVLKSTMTEVADTETLIIPVLFDKTLASDSYEKSLSLLLGSDVYNDVDISDNLNEDKLKMYLLKYSKKIYKNIPEDSFVLEEGENVKQIMLNVKLSEVMHSVLQEIKGDKKIREFMYEETKAVTENINKKYPYTTEFIKVPKREEYFNDFDKKIDEFIKDTQNSTIRVKTLLDDKRVIIEENMTVEDEKYEQLTLYYSEEASSVVLYDKYDTVLSVYTKKEKNDSETNEKMQISFNVTENREDKTKPQKMFRTIVESKTGTKNLKEITLPDEYYNIKDMSEQEKREITKTSKEKFDSLIAEVMPDFIK